MMSRPFPGLAPQGVVGTFLTWLLSVPSGRKTLSLLIQCWRRKAQRQVDTVWCHAERWGLVFWTLRAPLGPVLPTSRVYPSQASRSRLIPCLQGTAQG